MEIRRGAVVLAALVLAACGTGSQQPSAAEWPAGAKVVIRQLRADVLEVAGADRVPAARRALRDDSELYGLLVAFSDVGGCSHMVASLGTHPPQLESAEHLLAGACLRLQRAATWFTTAATRDDARALVTAARDALAALPLLDRAALALSAS